MMRQKRAIAAMAIVPLIFSGDWRPIAPPASEQFRHDYAPGDYPPASEQFRYDYEGGSN